MIRQLFKMITSVPSPSFIPLVLAHFTADYARKRERSTFLLIKLYRSVLTVSHLIETCKL